MLGACGLLLLLCTLGSSRASGFTETGLSLLGFQLCNYSQTRRVPQVEAVRTPRLTLAPCGGWIPWRRCPKTVYSTQYRAVGVPEARHVTGCCEGFEQLGLYCVLPLNRSLEFASRPGVCPTVGRGEAALSCSLDMDCPGLWKCCPLPGGPGCVAPKPPAMQEAPGTSWYNVTFLVKMSFAELQRVDPQLRGHARLLHAMVSSALHPLNFTVHPLHSAAEDPATTASQLLLGLSHPLPLAAVSTALDAVVKRAYEVIRVGVQDVDECLHKELCACTVGQLCVNTEGSHHCQPLGSPGSDCPPISDALISNITRTSFHLSWGWGSARPRPACVQLFQGPRLLRTARPRGIALEVAGLEAGVLYEVKISCPDCGANDTTALTIRTGSTISPSEAAQTPGTRLVTPAVGTHTAPSPETPVSAPSPSPPRGVPASGLSRTLGPLPGASTDQEAEVSSGAVSTGTGQATGDQELSTASCTLPGVTGGQQGAPHWPTPNATATPTLQPSPTQGPTGHETWQPSRPTWVPPAAPLESPKPQNLDLGPSSPSELPPTPPLQSQGPPACVPSALGTITISNVTGTGFHVAWEADLAPRPTFQITLTSPWGDREHLETPDTKVMLAGLEPGALYLLEILAKACGVESSRVHMRVRTAARTLRGRVRVANVQFSEALSNASSGEHRAFLQLFLGTVREALPAAMQGHVDAGRVLLRVSGLSGGSVVVDFLLLVLAHLDVREVSAAFLDAFRGLSLLEVARADTFIGDHDECAHGDHDCRPGSVCHNTLGSFTCDCAGGSESPVEYSGRPCEGDPLAHTAGPSESLMSTVGGASGAAPRLSLAAAVSILCEIQRVGVAIQRRFLRQEAVPESSLYLGQPACGVTQTNSTHVLLVAGWGQCGTVVQSNLSSTEVRTTLRSGPSAGGVMHHLRILSPVHCAFRNHLLVSSSYTPQWGELPGAGDLHGTGRFVTEMQVFAGDSPLLPNHSVSARAHVRVQVGLRPRQARLRVVLLECWATPGHDARDPRTFCFINNSCPVPDAHTDLLENGGSDKAGFRLRIFSFVNNPLVYLHCRLRVCLDAPGAPCRVDCSDVRTLRTGDGIATHQASWGPLVRAEGDAPAVWPGLGASSLVLATVAALVTVTGLAVLLVQRRRRVTGGYDLKVPPAGFGYHDFRP